MNPTALHEVEQPKASNIGSCYLPTIEEEKSYDNGGDYEKVDDEDSFNNSKLPRQSEIFESISEEQKFVQPLENTKPAGHIVSQIGKRQSSVRANRDTDKDKTCPQKGRQMNEMDSPVGPDPEVPAVIFKSGFDGENDTKNRSSPDNQSGIVEHTYGK